MKKLTRHLTHWLKFQVGNLSRNALRALLERRQGSAARLKDVLTSEGASTPHCQAEVLSLPVAHAYRQPTYMLSGKHELDYWEKFPARNVKTSTPAGVISARNVDVSLPLGLHMCQGNVFNEALTSEAIFTNPKYVLGIETIPFRRKKQQGEGVLLASPWHHNFFHWMLEILPRLSLLDQAEHLRHLPLILPRSAPGFVKTSLELTGYLDRVHFMEDGVYRFEKLHLLSRLCPRVVISPRAIAWLNQNFPAQEVRPRRRLYISRADASIRYVTNEAEVQSVLTEFGFETIVMSQYSLAEQVQLFREAEVVVGPHGAAFSHTAFMQEGTTFIELFQAGHNNPCFYRIANLRNLKYGFMVNPVEGLGLRVDTARLYDILEQALPHEAAKRKPLVAPLQSQSVWTPHASRVKPAA
jgi:hypothetical protein